MSHEERKQDRPTNSMHGRRYPKTVNLYNRTSLDMGYMSQISGALSTSCALSSAVSRASWKLTGFEGVMVEMACL